MFLTVVPDQKSMQKLQRVYMSFPLFSYFATTDELLEAATRIRPTLLILQADSFSDRLTAELAEVLDMLPDMPVLTLTSLAKEQIPAVLYDRGQVISDGIYHKTLLYKLYQLAPAHPNSSAANLSLIVHGLYIDPMQDMISVYGTPITGLSGREAYILLYIAERHPSPVSVEEIARDCSPCTGKLSRRAVMDNLNRINDLIYTHLPVDIFTFHRQRDTVCILPQSTT